MILNESVKHPIDKYITKNILTNFNLKIAWEIISMNIFEYDKEQEEKKLQNDEFKTGETIGFQIGFQLGYQIGYQKAVLDITHRLLALNKLSLEEISSVSGLSIDELKKLQQ